MQVADVDLEACKIRINQGKGSKDRYVLFGKGFATALRTHIAAHGSNRYLFQTRRNSKYTPRRVQQIVKVYAEKAGVQGYAAHLQASGDHLADAAQRPRRRRASTHHRPRQEGDAGRVVGPENLILWTEVHRSSDLAGGKMVEMRMPRAG